MGVQGEKIPLCCKCWGRDFCTVFVSSWLLLLGIVSLERVYEPSTGMTVCALWASFLSRHAKIGLLFLSWFIPLKHSVSLNQVSTFRTILNCEILMYVFINFNAIQSKSEMFPIHAGASLLLYCTEIWSGGRDSKGCVWTRISCCRSGNLRRYLIYTGHRSAFTSHLH